MVKVQRQKHLLDGVPIYNCISFFDLPIARSGPGAKARRCQLIICFFHYMKGVKQLGCADENVLVVE
jgi:hypothetical protein